jgi:hypothetical protein
MSGLAPGLRPSKGGQACNAAAPNPAIDLEEHAMSTTDRSTHDHARPQYGQSSPTARATLTFVAVLMSSTLLGGVLSLFAARTSDAALPRAAAEVPPVATQAVVHPARTGRPVDGDSPQKPIPPLQCRIWPQECA